MIDFDCGFLMGYFIALAQWALSLALAERIRRRGQG